MTEIYAEIAKLSDKFTTMAYGLTADKNKIDNAVQELMLYFLQMNPKTLKAIYDKDGENLMQEIIQTCAVYFAWAEAILSRSDNGN